MKTIEEKADSYIKRGWFRTVDGWINRVRGGYIQGYKEATRWRNPINEPPKINVSVFVKYETATGKLKYGVGRYVPLGIGNDWTVEGSTSREIIGWRPVEEDSL